MPIEPRFPDVMLLAAGMGLRLLPLTADRPKPLVEVAGRPLIDHVTDNAAAEGFGHFVVNTHYRAAQLREHVEALQRRSPSLRFRISEEAELLGTGGGIKRALPLLDGDPILVMNTDAFWPAGADAPLGRMVDRFERGGADMVMLCAQPRRALGFRRSHDFCLDPRGRLTRDSGQPVIYAGAVLLRRELVASVDADRFSLYPLFETAVDRETLAGVVLDAPWLHVGDPAALAEAEATLGASVT